eukprot:6197566-Pleurochrysis_carterae.AAC.4
MELLEFDAAAAAYRVLGQLEPANAAWAECEDKAKQLAHAGPYKAPSAHRRMPHACLSRARPLRRRPPLLRPSAVGVHTVAPHACSASSDSMLHASFLSTLRAQL